MGSKLICPLGAGTPCPEGYSQGRTRARPPSLKTQVRVLSSMGLRMGLLECFYYITPINIPWNKNIFQQLL